MQSSYASLSLFTRLQPRLFSITLQSAFVSSRLVMKIDAFMRPQVDVCIIQRSEDHQLALPLTGVDVISYCTRPSG